MRLVFMGTPDFAVPALAALSASEHEIVAVYTQPPRPAGRGQKLAASPVQRLAEAHRLPVFSPVSLKSEAVQDAFRGHRADAAIVVAYGLILPAPILAMPRLGCINVHPSALPRWRGAAPIQRTIMAGDRETEICIMRMDEGLDTGPVLLRERHPVPPGCTAGALHERLAARAGPLLLDALAHMPEAIPQAMEGMTYAAKIDKAEAMIDWARGAEDIAHQVLGLSPAPGAYFLHRGERYKILDAAAVNAGGSPGTVIALPLRIACGDGAIDVRRLQRPGKPALPISECLNGLDLPVGTSLDG